MQPANALDDRLGRPIEHDEKFLAIFDALAWNDEHGRVELRHGHLMDPLQSAKLFFPQSRVDLEKRHAREMIGKLLKQERLFSARCFWRILSPGSNAL
jgi:hypothetical protein